MWCTREGRALLPYRKQWHDLCFQRKTRITEKFRRQAMRGLHETSRLRTAGGILNTPQNLTMRRDALGASA
jgi:hypothetical protein